MPSKIGMQKSDAIPIVDYCSNRSIFLGGGPGRILIAGFGTCGDNRGMEGKGEAAKSM